MDELEKTKQEALDNVKKMAEETAKKTAESVKSEVDKKIDEIMKRFDNVTSKEEAEALKGEFNKEVQELQARVKELRQLEKKETKKSFNEYLAEAINENADKIRNFRKGSEGVNIAMKAVGDMSIAANFPAATPFIQEVNTNLIYNPYNRVWLADLLPQATSTANSIIYPKESGGEGGAALWTNPAAAKAQMDFDFATKTAYFKWVAGIVVVAREMLDDITWLTSYLQQKMLISLKTAENGLILNGDADVSTPVDGLLKNATVYDGTYTALVDKIIDAAYGQIPEDTFGFYVPSTVVINPRDNVAIGLNKATGSGEYDVPAGTVNFANGRLSIAGLDTVASTDIVQNNFLVLDRNATMFIRRMSPEIRMYEDSELAKYNKVMFRIEERVSLAVFNDKALVKGA